MAGLNGNCDAIHWGFMGLFVMKYYCV